MSKFSAVIGTDSSIDLSDENYSGTNEVTIESSNGTVCIAGPFADWMGYQVLADFDSADEGIVLAKRIAANPVAELDSLGYDHSGWFVAR